MKKSYFVPERRLATPWVNIISHPSGGFLCILSVRRQCGDTPFLLTVCGQALVATRNVSDHFSRCLISGNH